jgi:serine phosphatase RsbU (regulator of sigma subunit)/Tfp pilus assembly protein PilF
MITTPATRLTRLFCLFLFLNTGLQAQEDSLKTILFSHSPDSTRVQAALKLAVEYSSNDPENCIVIADKGLEAAKDTFCKKYIPTLLRLKGVAYVNLGEYKKSAELYFKALDVAEKQKNEKEIASVYNNLGVNFWYQKDYKSALKYHQQALAYRQKLHLPKDIAKSYNNLGIVAVDMGNYNEALEYYQLSIRIKDSLGDALGIANGNNNIGIVYENLQRPDDARAAYEKALQIFKQEGDKRGVVVGLNNIANIYQSQKDFRKALPLAQEALTLGKEIEDVEDLKTTYEILAVCSYHNGDYKQAYDHLQNYLKINDSLLNADNYKAVQEMEKKYNSEKQDKEIKLLQQSNIIKDISIREAEAQKRNLLIIILFAIITIGISVFAYYKIKRQKSILEENKLNIELKNAQLELQKKEIVDSINYAKRIQDAMLKDEEHVSMHLPPHFILFKPKDIVSGDFYWALEKDEHLYFAAADCTGHGVPGAFLTLLGTSFLNEINAVDTLFTPGQILDQLRNKIVRELSNHNGKTRDGMDISLIRINLKTLEGMWAGAYNPLWLIPAVGVVRFKELPATKQPVGYSESMTSFTDHVVQFAKGDQIYLFTDGFADQFGGKHGKKFKYKQMKELLFSVHHRSMEEQKQELNRTFDSWKGNLEQVDDILVVGMKF